MIGILLYPGFLLLAFAQIRAAFLLDQKYRVPFLYSYRNYLIFFFIYGFIKFVGTLFSQQLLPTSGLAIPTSRLLAVLIFPFFAIALYYLMLWIMQAAEKKPLRIQVILYWTIQSALLMLMIYHYFINLKTGPIVSSQSWLLIHIPEIFILYVILGLSLYLARKLKNRPEKKLIRNLGIIYLLAFSVYEAFQLCSERFVGENINYYAVIGALFFLINIPALIHLHRFLLRHHREMIDANIPALDGSGKFFEIYKITPREREVIELISAGRSNKEIGKALFISLQTVKNINYNIYKKTGVKNRIQLLRIIQSANRQEE